MSFYIIYVVLIVVVLDNRLSFRCGIGILFAIIKVCRRQQWQTDYKEQKVLCHQLSQIVVVIHFTRFIVVRGEE